MFGLNPNTVRTWERRYQFPAPSRSAGGHRTYGESEIELISRIVALTDAGVAPGEAIPQVMENPAVHPPPKDAAALSAYSRKIINALDEHSDTLLSNVFGDALNHLGYAGFIEDLAFPMLAQLGRNWEATGEGVAAEHAFTLAVTEVLLGQSRKIVILDTAPVITFACVPDELHQLPLLHLRNLTASENIARPLMLTAGLPMDEIIDASRRGGAVAILLSATVAPSSSDTRQWVARCINAGWENRVALAGPGFTRSRVYAEYPVRAAAGNYRQTLTLLRALTV